MIQLEFYLEEPSAEAAILNLVPAILSDYDNYDFDIFAFQGKSDLLKNLPNSDATPT